jgi:hypothetical protein
VASESRSWLLQAYQHSQDGSCFSELLAWLLEADKLTVFCVPSGEGGVDGDGDITRPENINAFRNFVLDNTDRKGVHFVMADGVGDCLWKYTLWVCSEFRGLFCLLCLKLNPWPWASRVSAMLKTPPPPQSPLKNALVLLLS